MNFQIFELHHRNLDCVGLKLDRSDSRNVLVRKINGIKWSQTHRCWYGEATESLLISLRKIFGENLLISTTPEIRDKKIVDIFSVNRMINMFRQVPLQNLQKS